MRYTSSLAVRRSPPCSEEGDARDERRGGPARGGSLAAALGGGRRAAAARAPWRLVVEAIGSSPSIVGLPGPCRLPVQRRRASDSYSSGSSNSALRAALASVQ